MFNWRDFNQRIDAEKDYTISELVGMGINRHAVYNCIHRGDLKKMRVFGHSYIKGADIKEYITKSTDKV